MKISILLLGFLTLPAFAAEPYAPQPGATLVTKIEWKEEALPRDTRLKHEDQRSFLSIEKTSGVPGTLPLWRTDNPGIRTQCYALRGTLRYRDVQGTGYLELWNQFPGSPSPARYFSRTLADVGPLQKITGTSDWRVVWIPFDGTQSKTHPEKLDLNLILPASASVDLSNLELYQFADAGAMWAALSSDAAGTALFPASRGTWMTVSAVAGISILCVIVLFSRRKRTERRRMRAMDRG